MDVEELKKNINKIINDKKMPKDVIDKLQEIYSIYDNVCSRCISNLRIVEQEGFKKEQIEELKYFISTESKQDIEIIDAINKTGYELKKENLKTRLKREVEKIDKNVEPNVENAEEDRVYIEKYLKEVFSNMISEIRSTEKSIKLKSANLTINRENDEKERFIDRTIKNFEEEIEINVIRKIETDIPQLGYALQAQDNEIYEMIREEVNKYKAQENTEEKSSEDRRKQFVENLTEGVNVNEQEARKKVEEKDEEVNKNNGLKALPSLDFMK